MTMHTHTHTLTWHTGIYDIGSNHFIQRHESQRFLAQITSYGGNHYISVSVVLSHAMQPNSMATTDTASRVQSNQRRDTPWMSMHQDTTKEQEFKSIPLDNDPEADGTGEAADDDSLEFLYERRSWGEQMEQPRWMQYTTLDETDRWWLHNKTNEYFMESKANAKGWFRDTCCSTNRHFWYRQKTDSTIEWFYTDTGRTERDDSLPTTYENTSWDQENEQPRWRQYTIPNETGKWWFHNKTEDWFTEANAKEQGWCLITEAHTKRQCWFRLKHDSTEEHFYTDTGHTD